MIRILFIGDVVGRPGRKLVKDSLPELRAERDIAFVVANGENAAGGKGLTPGAAKELFDAGVDVLTGGNHTWRNRDVLEIIDKDPRLLRPANYPSDPPPPGRGAGLYEVSGTDLRIGILNLMGRTFMPPLDCPFRVGRESLERLRRDTPLVVVDFHAEATSEKIALGWHLNGLATAVIGTHTHVATADERITEEGTALQTDVGMTGPHDGVLGIRRDLILRTMITQLPVRHELAQGDLQMCGLLIDADPETGHAVGVERICRRA